MKLTPEELKEFKKLYKFGMGQFLTGVHLESAEEAFEGGAKEYVVLPIITPIGMALILQHLEKKHHKSSNIFIVDHEKNHDTLKDALESFNKMPNGSKMSLLVWSGGHWRTAYCERKDNKNHIAIIDSLGFNINDNPIEKVINENPLLKENTIQYRSVNHIQVDHNNCGTFALRIAQKLAQEQNFLDRLREGELILTPQGGKDYVKETHQKLWPGSNQELAVTDNYFVMPPEYFSLAQKKSFLTHYKKNFGTRKDIAEFQHRSRKNDKTLFIDDLFNRKHRENALTELERGTESHLSNYNVLYFTNKYINDALISEAKKFAEKGVSVAERRQQISSISNRHMLDNEEGLHRMLSMPTNPSSLDRALSRGDMLEQATVQVNNAEKNALTEMHMDHYQILVAEENLEQSILAYQQESPSQNIEWATPLHYAVMNGDLETLKQLLDAGENPYLPDNNGVTPLYLAALYGHTEIFNELLTNTDINFQDEYGNTQLHLAALYGHQNVIENFLENGAIHAIRNKTNLTALDIANMNGYRFMVENGLIPRVVKKLQEETANYLTRVENLVGRPEYNIIFSSSKQNIIDMNINLLYSLLIAVSNANNISVTELQSLKGDLDEAKHAIAEVVKHTNSTLEIGKMLHITPSKPHELSMPKNSSDQPTQSQLQKIKPKKESIVSKSEDEDPKPGRKF